MSRGFVMKIPAPSSKLDSHFQKKLSGEIFFLFENYYLLISLENRAEKIRLNVGKSQRGFQAAFYFSIGKFWRKKFWKVFAFFVDFFGSIPVIEQEKFGRPVKTAFSVSIETFFVKKKLFWKTKKNFIIFRHWAEVFGLISVFWRVV